ncbi:MAG: hypothetical protein ABI759_19280 [Candidatus Solibacter sp.]
MHSSTDPMISRAPESRRWAALFSTWNRKAHYYLGLYFLFFLWLFSLSGLLLNHSSWAFAQFFPNRKISKIEGPIQFPLSGSDLDKARAVMRQFGIEGEIGWGATRDAAARLEFNVTRPGRVYQVQTDLKENRATVTLNEYNAWGVLRGMHTFVGVSPDDPRNRRDWILTTIWAMSMDAVAAGVLVLVLSGVYLWWNRREKRAAGLIALALGTVVCGLFIVGLRWVYG